MNATESNAIRATARKCWGDVESAWKKEGARNAQERKEIYLRILSKYETKYHPIYTGGNSFTGWASLTELWRIAIETASRPPKADYRHP